MWEPARHVFHPNSLLQPTPFLLRQLQRWQRRLRSGGCSSLLVATPSSSHVPSPLPSSVLLHIFSDAAKAANTSDTKGLGGFALGFHFHVPVPHEVRVRASIGLLELLACLVVVIVFAPLMHAADLVVLKTDSLTTHFAVAELSAHVRQAQLALELAFRTDAFRTHRHKLAIQHVFGAGNPVADAASRADLPRLQALAAQLRLPTTVAPLPQPALDLLAAVYTDLLSDAGLPNIDLLLAAGDVESNPGPILQGLAAALRCSPFHSPGAAVPASGPPRPARLLHRLAAALLPLDPSSPRRAPPAAIPPPAAAANSLSISRFFSASSSSQSGNSADVSLAASIAEHRRLQHAHPPTSGPYSLSSVLPDVQTFLDNELSVVTASADKPSHTASRHVPLGKILGADHVPSGHPSRA